MGKVRKLSQTHYSFLIFMKKAIIIIILLAGFLLAPAQDRTDSLHIAHYDIHLNVTDFTGHLVHGFADLTAVSKINGLPEIDLDLQRLQVDSIWVNGVGESNYSHVGNLIRIHLQNPMNQYDTANIRVYYSGLPATDTYFGGFVFSGEYAYNLGVAFRDLPHCFGRAWYPCLDFFTDKSTYSFNIQTEVGKRAVCGGYLTDSVAVDDNTFEWRWRLDDPVPTYLTSIAVGNYLHYADTVQGLERVIPIDIYAPPTNFPRVPATFAHLKEALHIFEDRFGPYPWCRIGYVGVDFNGGAMEHVTNIAYPNLAISGNSTYESLYVHEFSHMWFGDWVTCSRAEEMWLNEGFARYSESLVDEVLYHSDIQENDRYYTNMRDLHRKVLKTAHVDDDGYWALDSMPQSVTYGTTTYDKGGIIVHTLRKYMGDSLFFSTVRQYLATYAFQNISSQEFFDFFSQTSGLDLQDFYEGWVHQPGFPHFAVDSIRPTDTPNEYRFYVRQRLNHARHFINGNLIDITFFSADNQRYTVENFAFSGEYGEGTVTLPFVPTMVVVDLNEEMADAIIDYNYELTETGMNNATQANLILRISDISNATFARVEDNYVAADPLKTENENISAISSTHFWRIAYSNEADLEGTIRFTFRANNSDALDYDLLHGHDMNEIVLLYRRDAADDWQIIPSSISGNLSLGYLSTNTALAGEYAIGIGNRESSVADSKSSKSVQIYPNPASHFLSISVDGWKENDSCVYQILDLNGSVLTKGTMGKKLTKVNVKSLPSGLYVVRILSDNQEIGSYKFIKN